MTKKRREEVDAGFYMEESIFSGVRGLPGLLRVRGRDGLVGLAEDGKAWHNH